MDSLRRAGEILFRDRECADLPPGRPESRETAIRRRLLLAANDLEALGTWLGQEVEFDDLDTPVLAYLAEHAAEVGGQAGAAAEALRLAVLADDETALRSRTAATGAEHAGAEPPPPVESFRADCQKLAGALRPWLSRIRAAGRRLESLLPEESERDALREAQSETLPLHLYDMTWFVNQALSRLVAMLESLAVATEDRATWRGPDDTTAQADQVWRDLNGEAPAPHREPEGGDRG